MNIELAIKKPFSDFKNLAIGVLLSIVPIVNLFSLGYILNLIPKHKERKLPEFKDWGDLFTKGLLTVAISIIYALPVVLFLLIAAFSLVVSFFSGMALRGGFMYGKNPEMLIANWDVMLPKIMEFLPAILVALMLLLLIAYITPSAIARFIYKKRFSAAFELKEVFRKAFTAKYLTAFLLSVLAYLVMFGIFGWIHIIGPAFAGFTVGVFSYTLYGEACK